MSWEPVSQVAKNDAGQFIALIGDKWEPVAQAAKNDAGQFVVMRTAASQVENDAITQGAKNFNQDASFLQNAAAAYGKALPDLVRGAGQLIGSGIEAVGGKRPAMLPSQADIDALKAQDAPLMATAGGKVGSVLGQGALAVPSAGIGGVPGAALSGAAFMGAQPVATGESRALNAAIGAGAGAVGQVAGQKLGQYLQGRASNLATEAATKEAQNSVRDATLKAGQQAGYVVPPSAVNPSWINKRLESLAGKAAVGQEAAVRNQDVTNALARKSVGLPDSAPVTEKALEGLRASAGKAYQEVGAISPIAKQDLEALKQARFDANAQFKFYNRTGDPEVLKKAKEARELVNLLEQSLENEAKAAGRSDLIPALVEARKQIAKTYDLGRAVNVGDGSVSAPVLGRLLDKGRPLTEELATVGKMQQAFPSYMREGAAIPTPGVSKSEALAAALLAVGGSAAGGPLGAAAGALPLLSGPARSLVLSKPYQAMMASQSYSPGMLTQSAAKALPPERAAALLRSLGVSTAANLSQ